MRDIKGVISALITPMYDNEEINFDMLRKMIKIMLDDGVHGIFLAGSAGECCSLSDDEKMAVFEEGMQEIAGRVPVILGTGCINTKDTVRLSKRAEKLNPDALSVVTPYYIGLNQKQIYEHFKAVAEEVDVPVLIYNIPQRTGLNVAGETAAKLAEMDNIIGIKDSWGKIENFKEYLKIKNFICLIGNDTLIYEGLTLGAKGCISAYANVCPKLLVNIYESFVKGDHDFAKSEQERFMPLERIVSRGCIPGPIKQATNILGIKAGPTRMPMTGFDDAEGLYTDFVNLLESYKHDI